GRLRKARLRPAALRSLASQCSGREKIPGAETMVLVRMKPSLETRACPTLPARHRWEKRDLARATEFRAGLYMRLVERNANDLRVAEGKRIFLALAAQPLDQIGGGDDRSGQFEFFLGLADPFANPGEVQNFQFHLTRCRAPARK